VISEVRGRSETLSRNTSLVIISTQGGPYLYQNLDISSDIIYLTPSEHNVTGYVRNVAGNENDTNTAYNVTVNWTLPSNFYIRTGNSTLFFDNLSDSQQRESELELEFNSSNLPALSPGTYNITLTVMVLI
jgi:hypothetical protein